MIQRCAPLICGPMNSASAISAMPNRNSPSAARRTCRPLMKVAATNTAAAGTRKITCRLKKWKPSSPMRSATGGEAASEKITPSAMSRNTAPISAQSVENHQRASSPWSLREISIGLFPPPCQWPPQALRPVP